MVWSRGFQPSGDVWWQLWGRGCCWCLMCTGQPSHRSQDMPPQQRAALVKVTAALRLRNRVRWAEWWSPPQKKWAHFSPWTLTWSKGPHRGGQGKDCERRTSSWVVRGSPGESQGPWWGLAGGAETEAESWSGFDEGTLTPVRMEGPQAKGRERLRGWTRPGNRKQPPLDAATAGQWAGLWTRTSRTVRE